MEPFVLTFGIVSRQSPLSPIFSFFFYKKRKEGNFAKLQLPIFF
jgi:hypothetical protein